MNADFDIAVIGSGFGGALLAMIARRLGRSVVLLERGSHPRFAIGESSAPLANLLFEELAQRYDLPHLLPLTKWGTWQKTYPQIACGLKRGFTFYHHEFGQPFIRDPGRRNELLVAASPHDEIADTHWYRADVDHFLVQQAQSLGVDFLDEAKCSDVRFNQDSATIHASRHGQPFDIGAKFVIDATGPRGFLHHALNLPECPFEHLPRTQALFTHFTGVRRWNEIALEDCNGGSFRPLAAELPPYPVDDAAVHHIFDAGWIWVLRFNNGVTSAGVAANGKLANELCFTEGGAAWNRLLERLPSVGVQFANAVPQLPFVHTPRLSFRSGAITGARWALLPSAAGFVDPLLSTGFPLTLLGIARLAEVIENDWNTPRFIAKLEAYSQQTRDELAVTEDLVSALYATMSDFAVFSALSLLYFAAASFTETARRLGKPQVPGDSFLLGGHPQFDRRRRECCRAARELAGRGASMSTKTGLIQGIHRAIKLVDVAGLIRSDRRSWHPVEVADLFAASDKLSASEKEILAMLIRCGF